MPAYATPKFRKAKRRRDSARLRRGKPAIAKYVNISFIFVSRVGVRFASRN